MKAIKSLIVVLIAVFCLSAQSVYGAGRTVESERRYGLWTVGIGNELVQQQNGSVKHTRYAFIGTNIAASPEPIHLEFILPKNGQIIVMLSTPNRNGDNGPLLQVPTDLIVGNHSINIIGKFFVLNGIIFTAYDFPNEFFKWVKSVSMFRLQLPVGPPIDALTDGLNDAINYAFKLRKSL